jgi:hypothetical protein
MGGHGPFRGLDAPLALQKLYHDHQRKRGEPFPGKALCAIQQQEREVSFCSKLFCRIGVLLSVSFAGTLASLSRQSRFSR